MKTVFNSLFAGICLSCLIFSSARGQNTPKPEPSAQTQPSVASQIKPMAAAQIKELEDEKAKRTPAQLKIDSQLIYAIKMDKNEAIAPKVATLSVDVPKTDNKRVEV